MGYTLWFKFCYYMWSNLCLFAIFSGSGSSLWVVWEDPMSSLSYKLFYLRVYYVINIQIQYIPGTGELASVSAFQFAECHQLLQVRMTALIQVSQWRMTVVHQSAEIRRCSRGLTQPAELFHPLGLCKKRQIIVT